MDYLPEFTFKVEVLLGGALKGDLINFELIQVYRSKIFSRTVTSIIVCFIGKKS